MLTVSSTPKEISFCRMGTFLRGLDYVYPVAVRESYLFGRFIGRSFWRKQDPYGVKGTLLLAWYGEGCAGCPSQVRHLSDGKESCATARPIYSIARTHSAMSQCEYGFHFGSTSDPKGQGFNICGSRSVFKDGPFHTVQQDQRRDSHRGVVFQGGDETVSYTHLTLPTNREV